MRGPGTFPCTTVDVINAVHLGYTRLIKQHEIKSSTGENDAIKRRGNREMREAAAGVTWPAVSQQTCSPVGRVHSNNIKYSIINT